MRIRIPILIILGGLLLVLAGLWLTPVQPVSAQCKDPSTCKTCHEVQGQKSVMTSGLWHQQHGVYDFCAVCHGGDRKAADAATAHQGMTTKLEGMGGACKQCHIDDLETRYAPYAKAAGISEKPNLSAVPGGSKQGAVGTFLGTGSEDVQPGATPGNTGSANSASAPVVKTTDRTLNAILFFVLVLVLTICGSYVMWNEARRKHTIEPDLGWIDWFAAQVCRETWSPYAAGVLLGVVAILAVFLSNHLLGASGAVAAISSTLLTAAAPTVAKGNMYYQFVMPPGFSWEIALLIGIFFGGMFGAISSNTFKIRWDEDGSWKQVFGPQRWKRFVFGFLGAVILQYGAGIAGGCTSGLAISGGMLLAPSAFIFIASMFASGIVVALLVYRRRF